MAERSCGETRIISPECGSYELDERNSFLQGVFSGSSALRLEPSKGDLSRRAVMYAMSGLPFRESVETYHRKLEQTLALVIDLDIPLLFKVERDKLASLKKLLMLCKPEKLYLANTNNAWALCPAPPVGTLRETFFASQLAHVHARRYPAEGGDFIVDDRWMFEIGGPGKTDRQIEGHDVAYLALDDIEHGRRRRVPLWMFGFLN